MNGDERRPIEVRSVHRLQVDLGPARGVQSKTGSIFGAIQQPTPEG